MLGHAKERLVLFLKIFQLPFPIPFILLLMIDCIRPVTQGPSQGVLDGFLVGTFTKAIQFPLAIKPSLLLAFFPYCNVCIIAGLRDA